MDQPLIRCQSFKRDRPSRMQPSGGNTDLRTQTEFAAIGVMGLGIVHHNRTIDFCKKARRDDFVAGDNGIGMVRTVASDMFHRLIEPCNDPR